MKIIVIFISFIIISCQTSPKNSQRILASANFDIQDLNAFVVSQPLKAIAYVNSGYGTASHGGLDSESLYENDDFRVTIETYNHSKFYQTSSISPIVVRKVVLGRKGSDRQYHIGSFNCKGANNDNCFEGGPADLSGSEYEFSFQINQYFEELVFDRKTLNPAYNGDGTPATVSYYTRKKLKHYSSADGDPTLALIQKVLKKIEQDRQENVPDRIRKLGYWL